MARSEGTKKAQSSPQHQMAPCHLGSAGGFGLVWFRFSSSHKKLAPSLKKGPFKNDAELTLLELKGVGWAARICKIITGWRIDIFSYIEEEFCSLFEASLDN